MGIGGWAMSAVSDVDAIIEAAPSGELDLPAYTGSAGDMDYLKSYVLSAVTARYGVSASDFEDATLLSTSILRDFVHRAVYDHPSLTPYTTLFADNPNWYQSDVGGLFRVEGWALCGEISWQLQNVYQAFGYQSSLFWTFNGEDGTGTAYSYNDGHVRVDVMVEDLDKYIDQDVTYNWLLLDENDEPLSYREAQILNYTDPDSLSFHDNGIATYVGTLGTAGVPGWLPDYYRSDYMKVTYGWESNGQFSQQLRETHLDWYSSHTAVVGGAYANAAAAHDAIVSLHSAGKTLVGVTDALRERFDVSGFRLLSNDGSSLVGDFVTVQLNNASYVTINIDSGEILNGSYDQIVDDLTGSGRNLNPGTDLSEFFGPAVFIRFDGTVIAQWELEKTDPLVAPLFAEQNARAPIVHLANGNTLQTFYDAYDAPWSQIAEYYNSDHIRYFRTIAYDNGDFAHVAYDHQNQASWSFKQYTWDATGQLYLMGFQNDDGTRDDTYLDANNALIWTDNSFHYDAGGHLVSSITHYDNGGWLSTKYDYLSTQVWTDWQSRYDSAGRIEAELVHYDSGGNLKIQHDSLNQYAWSNQQYRTSVDGALEAQLARYDNGGSLQTNYDTNSSKPWWDAQYRYDASKTLEAIRLDWDAGGYSQTNFDTKNTQVWSSNTIDYNAGGQLTHQAFAYDTGGILNINYDRDNQHDWLVYQARYDAGGVIEAELITYDDGSTVRHDYHDGWLIT
jgi:hypothetical protein